MQLRVDQPDRLPLRTYLYLLAQSVNLTTAVMSVTMAALVGAALAPEPWMSTIPYGFQFLFVMLMTYPASWLMSRIGRKKAFLLATIPLAASGLVGFGAVEAGVFLWLVLAHCLLGIYIAFANFNRFAATDGVSAVLKPRAISLVVAGGVIAAIVGPLLTRYLKDFAGVQAFAACYAAFIGLALVSLVLNLCVREPVKPAVLAKEALAAAVPVRVALKNRLVVLAIAIAALGYGVMNLLMIQSSMHMTSMQVPFSDVSAAIQWHVLAMFAPSFITGALIQRLGLKAILFSGAVLLLVSCVVNLSAQGYWPLTLSLIALGLGWNFTYVGGSALLTRALEATPELSVRVQGLNDFAISVFATLGALGPAFLLAWLGWKGTNVLSMGLCLLLLAASLVIRGRGSVAQAR